MKRSSSLDCSSIGQSLKRVKISTSPGELRLDRDIEGLIGRWTSAVAGPAAGQFDNHGGGRPRQGATGRGSPRGCRVHGDLHCPGARLARDPVDPLRLRLTCLHQPVASASTSLPNNESRSSSSPLPTERWTFLIQIPRMYPHLPPAITRVTRDLIPNNENMAHLGNLSADHYHHHGASAAMMVLSSVMQNNVEPPVPEQVLIQPLPLTPHCHGANVVNSVSPKSLDIDLATACFNSWTPVSVLEELIDFLMAIPARRREWWAAESNRRHHQEQLRLLRNAPVGQPTIAPAAHNGHRQQQLPQYHQQQKQFSSAPCDMEDGGDMDDLDSMMDDAGSISTERRANPFTANRFDVGYDRGNMMRRWGVR